MDKTWMLKHRLSTEYKNGLNKFLDMAFDNVSLRETIICPCKRCKNANWVNRETAKEHLTVDGFIKGYTRWTAHGEGSSSNPINSNEDEQFDMAEDMHDLIYDTFGIKNFDENVVDEPNEQAKAFYSLLDDAQHELYPGCKNFSKLKFIIRLFQLKVSGKWSNKSFTLLLELLKEAFPNLTKSLPSSFYEVRKIIGELGLNYIKIDACPNDCMLYWKEHEKDTSCHICKASRYVETEHNSETEDDLSSKCKKVSAKVLRYFPIKPRLQRLFMSSKTASFMRWHKEECTKDGHMRHPSDSPLWHDFDRRHADFAKESRNVRLGLAADGFSPFRTMSVAHSTWPVILTPYNLPPWMCMTEPFFFLTLLIPGPSSPRNNIDVYLQPLIEELKELWNGVDTYDASTKQNFNMRAALLWTINDFPAYANLSGWSTKGELACPSCHKDTSSRYLYKSRKQSYMGHRKFLNRNHPYRRNSKSFDGHQEHRSAPRTMTGKMVLDELFGFNVKFGKKVTDNPSLPHNWKKRSIFFELPYWKDILIRHMLDVMHIEKNVCECVIATIMNLEGKSKDHENSRLDLEEMGIRSELHPITLESGKKFLPPPCFLMNKKEKDQFCDILQNVKVPDGYSSNISRRVQAKPNKISGLKSHDNHILMQQLLPISLRKLLPKHVRAPLIKLCKFFRELCGKVLNPTDLIRMEKEIALVLCDMEKIFPPSFFDIMMHLPIHLAYEARIAGPVQYRWMYPIERYLSTLKSYVRNQSHPEGSIAEAYLLEECLTFCSRYLNDVETKFNKIGRNDDSKSEEALETSIFSQPGRHIGKAESIVLDVEKKKKAHQYVLFNSELTESFIEQHKDLVKLKNPRLGKKDIEQIHSDTFPIWFSKHVENLHLSGNQVSEELRALARGPNPVGKRYRGFIINGFRFHVKKCEVRRRTQNSGVVVTAQTSSFASTRDNNPVVGEVTYYGVLNDIIELEYFMGRKIVVFDCNWVSTGSARKKDMYGFTIVNFSRSRIQHDPFILSSQAQQVFYVEDPTEKGWYVVVKTTARDTFDMDPILNINADALQETNALYEPNCEEAEDIVLVREDVEGITVMPPLTRPQSKRVRSDMPEPNKFISKALNDTAESLLGVFDVTKIRKNLRSTSINVQTPNDGSRKDKLTNVASKLNESGLTETTSNLKYSKSTHAVDKIIHKADIPTNESVGQKSKRARGPNSRSTLANDGTTKGRRNKEVPINVETTSYKSGATDASLIQHNSRNNVSNVRNNTNQNSSHIPSFESANVTSELHGSGLLGATQTQNNSKRIQVDVGLSNERINQNILDNPNGESGERKAKRVRGPTCMPKVWGLTKPVNVSFNHRGQPNDIKKTSTLAHFLGTIARNGKYCPLNYTDWRLIPQEYKDDMLDEVKLKFKLPTGSDDYILHSINKKWRNWKSQVKNMNFNKSVSVEEQLRNLPDRVNEDQYKDMLEYWFTEKAHKQSDKNKDSRAKLEILHRMGKRSYALVSEIMKEHIGRYPTRAELFEKCCQPPDGSCLSEEIQAAIDKMKELASENEENLSDFEIVDDPDDDFAKVMGKDKEGQLRMFGMGVKPADIYGKKPSRDALFRKSMQGDEELKALKKQVEELTAIVQGGSHSGGQSEKERAQVSTPTNPKSYVPTQVSTPNNSKSSVPTTNSIPIRVGAYVTMKSLSNINEPVAIGIVRQIGGVQLHGRDLGPGICEIVVQSVLKEDEMLIYPHDYLETIGSSLGAPIAWPLSLITKDDDEF